MRWAVTEYNGPVAVRYPRGGDGIYTQSAWGEHGNNSVFCHRKGNDVTIVTYGTLINNALEAAEILESKGICTTVLRLLSAAPLHAQQVLEQMSENAHVVVLEETCSGSGICRDLAWELHRLKPQCRVDCIDLGANYVTHGAVCTLYKSYGLDAVSVANYIREVITVEN